MTPLVLTLIGVALLAGGWLLMRSLGPRARIGRILAATPVIPVERALELAASGTRRYIGVGGRIDASEDFEDESGRPLVLRHTRIELGDGRRWTTLEDSRTVLPFSVAGGTSAIAVDEEELGEGLITVVRESEGVAAEAPDAVPAGTDPATRVRLQVESLSTIDHALVLGVPGVDPVRGPILRAGLGRPLILTTLEPGEAMRLLAAGRRGAAVGVTVLLLAGLIVTVTGLAWAFGSGIG